MAVAAGLEAPAVRAQPQQAGAMKLPAVVLLLVVVYAVALELVPWPWPAVLAVPASIATVLAAVALVEAAVKATAMRRILVAVVIVVAVCWLLLNIQISNGPVIRHFSGLFNTPVDFAQP